MLPKDLAIVLYNKFYEVTSHSNSVEVRKESAKKNAMLCVEELIKHVGEALGSTDTLHFYETAQYRFYKNAIIEIEKL